MLAYDSLNTHRLEVMFVNHLRPLFVKRFIQKISIRTDAPLVNYKMFVTIFTCIFVDGKSPHTTQQRSRPWYREVQQISYLQKEGSV